jgi:hypothetical protein
MMKVLKAVLTLFVFFFGGRAIQARKLAAL